MLLQCHRDHQGSGRYTGKALTMAALDDMRTVDRLPMMVLPKTKTKQANKQKITTKNMTAKCIIALRLSPR